MNRSPHQTAMFRDSAYWRDLRSWLLSLPPGMPFRVWSAACSTGEEVQSLALLLQETELDWHVTASDKERGVALGMIFTLASPALLADRHHAVIGRVFDDPLVQLTEHYGRVTYCSGGVDLARPEGHPVVLGRYDLILARNVFPWIPAADRVAALDTLQRCVKPGGRIDFGHLDAECGHGRSWWKLPSASASVAGALLAPIVERCSCCGQAIDSRAGGEDGSQP
jgi:chemotaxis protein methyltransferase CheR